MAVDYVGIMQTGIINRLKPLETIYDCRVSSLDLSQLHAPTVMRSLFVNHKSSTFSAPQFIDNFTQLREMTWEVMAQYVDLRSNDSFNPIHADILDLLADFTFPDSGIAAALFKPLIPTSERLVSLEPATKKWIYSFEFRCTILFTK